MKRKRFISIAAALCLALTAAPMSALAQEEGEQPILEEIQEKPQEEIEEEPQEEIEPAEEEKEEPQEEIKEEQQFSAFSFEENGIEVQAEGADFRGKGEENDPYLIQGAADLKKLAERVNAGTDYSGKYFKQTSSIDLENAAFTPIGTNSNPFKGKYDGNGHSISNINITGNSDYVGLFGYAENAEIKNCGVSGTLSGKENVGGIAGKMKNSTVINCYAKANLNGSAYVGGMIGVVDSNTTVEKCYYTGSITATGKYVGGITGWAINTSNSKIKNCVSLAESLSGKEYVKRIGNNGKLEGNYSWDKTKIIQNGNLDSVTGAAANNAQGADLTYAANTLSTQLSLVFDNDTMWIFADNRLPALKNEGTQPTVMPTYMMAGADDFLGEGTKENPYRIRNIRDLKLFRDKVNNGTSYEGKYFEQTEDIDLNNEEWTPIGTYDDVGQGANSKPFKGIYNGGGKQIANLKITNGGRYIGLFGYAYNAIIQNCNVTGEINGVGSAGGIVGFPHYYTTIENCSFCGTIEGTGSFVGGIVGETGLSSTIKNCYVIGSVKGAQTVGGIAGLVLEKSIENCYALADVTATSSSAGGIAGRIEDEVTVKNCYHSGKVSGGNRVGGIAGFLQNGRIENCVSLAESVTGGSYVSRIAGYISNATISDCYAYNRTKLVTGAGENQTVTYPTGSIDDMNGAEVYISKGKVVRDVASSENFWNALGFTGDNGWTVPNEPYALPYLWEGNKPMLAVDLTIDETPQHFTTKNIGDGFVVTVTNKDVIDREIDEKTFQREYRLSGTSDAWTTAVPRTAGIYDVKITRTADGNINPFVCEISKGLVLTRKRSSSSDDTIPSYTVQFDSNGGSAVDKIKTDANGKIERPADPVKEGYVFAGWYSDSKLTKKFDFNAKPTANITLYAKWSENKEIVLTIGSRTVSVFGSEMEYDAAPKIVNDRTMLPIRIVAEGLGATVTWNGAQQRVTIQKGEDVILIVIGADTMYVNGKAVQLDAAAFTENGRTYLPLRFVSENLGAQVLWNETNKTVTIIKES